MDAAGFGNPNALPFVGRIRRRTEAMRTRDGTRLVADLFEPEAGGPYPVLMMRQAYGRKVGTSLCYAPPEWYAARGYIVVIQDVRGRGDSEGAFELFEHEADDGADSVAWAAELPNCNGQVGMFGFSFQGTNQLLAASRPTPALRAIAPAMIGWDLRRDWAYENGAFALRAGLGWATQLAAETARRAGDLAGHTELASYARALPLGVRPGRPDYMQRFAHYSHYDDWAAQPDDGEYWRRISPSAHLDAIEANQPAVFLIGGWYDSHLPGTLAAFAALRGRVPLRLVLGPWTHFPWDRKVGDLDFGPEAITDIDQQQIAFFDRWLKPAQAAADTARGSAPCSLRLFDMGVRRWREPALLATPEKSLWLVGRGRAAIDGRDGTLSELPGDDSEEYLVHDPWRPAAPVGGSFGLPAGPIDRSAVDARADVLTFTTAPLDRRQAMSGLVRLSLDIEPDSPAYDLHATLSLVRPGGEAYALAEGFGSYEADGRTVSLPMRATRITLAAGDRLRLSLAAACFPAFAVNPGSGSPPWEASMSELRVIRLCVRTGAHTRSVLLLPFINESEEIQ